MKARVLFLDDEPQTSRRLKGVLEKAGYVVSSPKTAEEAFHEININKAELLIHTAHRTKTYWEICDAIFQKDPNFPSLHFATGLESENFHGKLKGPFHYKLRHLIPEKEFLKRIRKLLFLTRLHKENRILKEALEIHKNLDMLFDSLDPAHLQRQMVEFFSKEFKTKNAFFLLPGGYGYFLQEMWKVSTLGSSEDERQSGKHKVVSAEPCTEQEFSNLLNQVTPFLPTAWELKKTRTYVEGQGSVKSFCAIPLVGHRSNRILGYVLLLEPARYGDEALEKTLPHAMHILGRHLEHVLNFADAKSMSYIDDLTDLYNQRYLKMVLDKEINRCRRTNNCFSVLFMDIDHFKRVNDTRGHLIGSSVLVELSKIIHNNIRTVDYGFRYGGDEFITILIGSNSEQALVVAERIRKQVETHTFDVNGVQVQVTLSIGIATYPDHAQTKEQIIEIADRAMYCGKHKSRNVVYVAS